MSVAEEMRKVPSSEELRPKTSASTKSFTYGAQNTSSPRSTSTHARARHPQVSWHSDGQGGSQTRKQANDDEGGPEEAERKVNDATKSVDKQQAGNTRGRESWSGRAATRRDARWRSR